MAPGEDILSTVALQDADRAGVAVTLSLQPGLAAGVLQSPKPTTIGGSKTGKATGQLVWCGLAQQRCQGAKGKICLIQRGALPGMGRHRFEQRASCARAAPPVLTKRTACCSGVNFFCEKIRNCIAGGGIGAILFNKAEASECQALSGVTMDSGCEPNNPSLLAIGLSKGQGLAVKAMLDRGTKVTATIGMPDVLKTTQPYG